MLAETLNELYSSLRIYFYRSVFARFETREATLTTVEAYSIECIHALGSPTVSEFAAMMGISGPNAAARVNSLLRKGYLERVQSDVDKREFHLLPTEKYFRFARINAEYMSTLAERCRKRFTPAEIENLDAMLKIIHDELMPEIDLSAFLKISGNAAERGPVPAASAAGAQAGEGR
ncbi:MarR family winged helix-turn-helix transcriptional regulator [Lachnoclostridium sp. Marseille-P6806]|uniref:MarR family winged helix-turn-helix transcriptional regulator n=1 Tax=Lachnoclostridium sp. Marseille-P6806 TaxID=2364793 RepID=UPI001030AE51|nr:MarR family transcriptional regulator [Lachnoclostridium sp. Marseille-P6806]